MAKSYASNWPEEVFVIKKTKHTIPWKYVKTHFNGEKFSGTFTKNNWKKQIKQSLELKM